MQLNASPRLIIATVLFVLFDVLGPGILPAAVVASPQKVSPAIEASNHLIEASKAYDSKKFLEAVRLTTLVIDSQFKGPSAYWIRGSSLLKLEKPEAALQDLDKCLNTSGISAQFVHEARAQCYVELDKLNEAINELDLAIAIHPTASLCRMKGEICFQHKRDDMALQCFKKALAIDPKDYWSYRDMASIYDSQKNYAAALERCNRMIRLRPSEPEGYGLRAKIYQHMGKPDLAKKDLEQTNRKSDFPF